MKYRFTELMDLDDQLFQLASYEASRGLIPLFSTTEEILEFRRKTAKIFNEFKTGIQRGSFNLHHIKNRVSKFGPIYQEHKSNNEIIEDVINGIDNDIIVNENLSTESYNELLEKYEKASQDLNQLGTEGIKSLVDILGSWKENDDKGNEEESDKTHLDEIPDDYDYDDDDDGDDLSDSGKTGKI